MIVSFDPGANLGVAYVTREGTLERGTIVDKRELPLVEIPKGATVLVGDGTGSTEVVAGLKARGIDVKLVPEEGTSLEARDLYFSVRGYRWWQRLLPKGLRYPPVPVDDFAAYAVALRWLAGEGER